MQVLFITSSSFLLVFINDGSNLKFVLCRLDLIHTKNPQRPMTNTQFIMVIIQNNPEDSFVSPPVANLLTFIL